MTIAVVRDVKHKISKLNSCLVTKTFLYNANNWRIYLLVSSADNICKQFRTLAVFLLKQERWQRSGNDTIKYQEFFSKKLILKQYHQTTKMHEKKNSWERILINSNRVTVNCNWTL